MSNYDMTPSEAERYFDSSIFGQLYTTMAAALGRRLQRSSPPPAAATASADTASVLERLDRWFSRQEQKARDDYLASSADVFELERRIEALERGLISRYY